MAKTSKAEQIANAKKILVDEGYSIHDTSKYTCVSCSKSKSLKQGNYYQTNNPMYEGCVVNYRDSKGNIQNHSILPICKGCIEKMYNEFCIQTKNDKKYAMYLTTVELRLVWNETLYEACEQSKSDTFRVYIGKLNSLPQYSSLVVSDSDDYIGNETSTVKEDKKNNSDLKLKGKDKKEALLRWGGNWDESQLKRLEDFYYNMKQNNKIETPQDEDYVKKLARLSVKIDEAIENDESGKAKQLGDLYSKYMSDAKFRASDMSGKDANGGARTISQIAEEVESDEFIPPWEKYAYKLKIAQDIVDKTIMYMLNFVLRFKDRPMMSEPTEDTPKVGEIDEL